MKTTLKIGSIEIQGIKLNDLEVSQEYTTREAIDLAYNGKNLVKNIIKELPEIFEDLEIAFNKFEEIDARVTKRQEVEATRERIERRQAQFKKAFDMARQMEDQIFGCEEDSDEYFKF